jgi:uncharacterized protein YqgQ
MYAWIELKEEIYQRYIFEKHSHQEVMEILRKEAKF